ncbi:OmpA family protein [Psychrobacter lutiphocae]|uniref:OmpA family protein n=1 Tax=Psychrobacter lutiphocae TaxID=540500 RepID=UPI000381EDCA|nr:OmpA family protein [Psychrobacter lutiphocae]
MKFNKMTLAILAATAPMVATAGVTVTPLLLGYHYSENSTTQEKQGDLFGPQGNSLAGVKNPKDTHGGVAKEDGLYTGAAIGIELTPSTQFQIEYGVSDTDAQIGDTDVGDMEQRMISANLLVGFDQFTGYRDSAFRPYALIGAGQSKLKYESRGRTRTAETKDTIGNLGLGAMYRINDALSLRGEARAIHNFDNNWWEGMALAGLEVVLGGHLAPAVVAPPVATVEPTPVVVVEADQDSDGDGVVDRLDQCPNTPPNVVVDERGCPVQVQIDDELKMELRVFFDNDKSVIKEQYKPEIAKVAEKMREYPNSSASIEGHASKTSRSSATYNQRLSEARAIAVKSMLTNEFGIAPNRLSTVGYGFDRPIAPNDTEEGRAMNRRVYAVITGNKTMTVDQTKDMNVQ